MKNKGVQRMVLFNVELFANVKSFTFYPFENLQMIDFIIIVPLRMFQPITPSAFFRCFISNSGAYTEP